LTHPTLWATLPVDIHRREDRQTALGMHGGREVPEREQIVARSVDAWGKRAA